MESHLARCLVTGVAGFIGSHLAERLIAEGYDVVGIDCFTDYYPRAIKERNLANLLGNEHFALIDADLIDTDLETLLCRPSLIVSQGAAHMERDAPINYVFHLAAQAGVRASWGKDFAVYTKQNVLATQKLLEAAKQVALKRFVYASSSSIYGDTEIHPTPEAVTPKPVSPYGVTKLAGEHLCLLYWKNYHVPTIILRYFTVYGPRQRPDMGIYRFIGAIMQSKEIKVYGDGEQTRDFTFVSDAVEANIQAMRRGTAGSVFNIGGGAQVSVSHLITLLEDILQLPAQVLFVDRQKGDVKDTSADISYAQQILGYQPHKKIRDGLECQVCWQSAEADL